MVKNFPKILTVSGLMQKFPAIIAQST